jgi:uncharacterized protein YbjT (DUF2867 family)
LIISTDRGEVVGMITDSHILVTGGTGKTGSRVAARLRAAGRSARIGSRNGEPPFDWHDRTTWAAALDGVAAAYLAYAPDIGFRGAAGIVGDLARAAVDAGVRRLVLLSGRGEEGAHRAERLVRSSGADWTIVRAAVFAQNFTEGAFAGSVHEGVVAMPAPDVAEPFVDVDDIADVAAAALLDDRHVGAVSEVAGPRLLTFTAALDIVGRRLGHPVRFQYVSPDEMVAGLLVSGMPADEAVELVALFATILDGRNAHLADGVQRALGRAPRDLADVVVAAFADGAVA